MHYREMSNTNAANLHSYRCPLRKVGSALGKNCEQEVGQVRATQSLDANTNNGWRRGPSQGEQGVKIGVQGNDDTILVTTQLQDRTIFRSRKAKFTDMNRVDTRLA